MKNKTLKFDSKGRRIWQKLEVISRGERRKTYQGTEELKEKEIMFWKDLE